MFWGEFATLALVHFLAVIAPGPDFAVTVSQSVRYGRYVGTVTAMGIGLGISVHVLYTLIGVGALIHASDVLMNIARLCGGLYVGYLGVQLLRAQPRTSAAISEKEVSMPTPKAALVKGFLTNATNPKATLFFLAIFTTLVSPQTPMWVQGVYGVWMCFINALWFVGVAVFFSNERVRTQFIRLGHWFERVTGVVLLMFALKLLIEVSAVASP